MPDFPTYSEREERSGRLRLGLGVAGLSALLIPGVRKGAARILFQGAERVGARWGMGGPSRIAGLAAELRQMERSGIPGAARQALGLRRSADVLEEALGRGVEGGARARAEQIVRTRVFRGYAGGSRVPARELLLDERIASVLEEQIQAASQANPALVLEEIRRRETARMLVAFRRAQRAFPTLDEVGQLGSVQQTTRLFRRAAGEHLAAQARATESGLGAGLLRFFGARQATPGSLRGTALAQEFQGSLEVLEGFSSASIARGVAVGGVYHVGDRVVDLRRFHNLAGATYEWLRENFQVPLAPGFGGISPFQLFPWMRGRLPRQVTHISGASRDPVLRGVLGTEGDEIGLDLFQVGRRFIGANFERPVAEGAARFLDLDAELRSGLWGYMKRRTHAVLAAQEARAAGRAPGLRGWFGGRLDPEEGIGTFISRFTKFRADSDWAPRLFRRILNEEVSARELRQAGHYLTDQRFGRRLEQALKERGRGLFSQDLGDLVGRLDEDEAVIRFFERAASDPDFRAGTRLHSLVGSFRNAPMSVMARVERGRDREVFGLNLLGRERDLRGIDLMRRAVLDEVEERLVQAAGSEQGFIHWVRSLKLSRADEEAALAYGHGKAILRRLDEAGAEEAAAWLRNRPEAQEAVESFVRGRSSPYAPWGHNEEPQIGVAAVIAQRAASPRELITAFNRARRDGAGFLEALGAASNSRFTRQFSAFFTGNQQDVTTATLAMEYFPRRLEGLFRAAGLGLPDQDLLSGGSVFGNLLLKRVLPVALGVEAYRYADYQGERLVGAGPSDAYANVRAWAGQLRASWLGERIPLLGRRELFPGLERVIPTRSLEEEREHQARGFEPVRKGRFWAIGSRTEFWGEKIDYFAPGAVRAARSHWQGAENVDLNTRDYWAHSFLPLPENRFLGPLRALLFPGSNYWWEEKHAQDRPYVVTGELFDPQTVHGPLFNATLGRLLKPRRILHPEYLPTNLGGTASREEMRRINRTLKSGADLSGISGIVGGSGGGEVQLFSPGVLGEGGGGEGGSLAEITPGGRLRPLGLPSDLTAAEFSSLGVSSYQQRGHGAQLSRREIERINRMTRAGAGGLTPLRPAAAARAALQTNPFREEDLDLIDFQSGTITGIDNLQDVLGLYGWMTKKLHTSQHDFPVVATPQRAYGFARRFWDLHIGGLGGDLSEVGRRFLTRPERMDLWNPVPNQMPSWLPGCFVAGTSVLTQVGLQPIENLCMGDHVFSHTGELREVEFVNIREYSGDYVEIEACGVAEPIVTTHEHPFYLIRSGTCPYYTTQARYCIPGRHPNANKPCRYCKSPQYCEPAWVKADTISVGDFLLIPIPPQNERIHQVTIPSREKHQGRRRRLNYSLDLDWTFGCFIGFYLSEGWCSEYAAILTSGREESDQREAAEVIAQRLGCTVRHDTLYDEPDRGCLQTVLHTCELARWLKSEFGENAEKKRIPSWVFDAPREFQRGVLAAYLEGDGWLSDGGGLCAASASATLIHQLILLLAQQGVVSSVHRSTLWGLQIPKSESVKLKPLCHSYGRKISQITDTCKGHAASSTIHGGYLLRRVTRVRKFQSSGPVYNLQVAEEHTYNVQGLAVHNSEYMIDFRHGDPFAKIPRGELRLPGEAYERLNPELKLMQMRASGLGKSVPEMMQQMLHLQTPLSAYGEEVTELGERIHHAIQMTWKRMGVLAGAETQVYDEALGISGHFDAVLNTRAGFQVVEIKTVGEKRFAEARRTPFAEHVSQVNFYLHATGLRSGQILYVNRDDPSQVRAHHVRFDQREFDRTVARVQEARANLTRMLEAGLISRGDLYDPVTRFEILADVAPYSDQYAQIREYLTEQNKAGELSVRENDRFQSAKKRVAAQKKRVNITPYRFQGSDLREEWVTVGQILDPNTFTIRESENPIRLAGVRSSQERIAQVLGRDPEGQQTLAERQFARFGIRPGARVRVLLEGDPEKRIADDVLQTQHAVVFGRGGNVNRQLLERGIATEKEGDYSDTGVAARFTPWEQFVGRAWETVAHLDTPINSKFLRVRSPLEELQRGIVYGKNTGGWQNPVRDYVFPTIESYVARNPIIGGLSLGAFASFFFSTSTAKRHAFTGGAALGAGLSVIRWVQEGVTGEVWKPARTRRREEVEEYWDVLKYVKLRAMAAHEAELARRLEGVDVDRMEREVLRQGERRKRRENWLNQQKRRLKRGDRDFRSEIDDLNWRYRELINARKLENRERIQQVGQELNRLRRIGGRGPEAQAARREQIQQIQAQLNELEGPQGMMKLGPHATRALQFRELYRSTLYGIDPGETPFLNLFRAFPKYKRELIQGFIDKSSEKERERIFRLLPRHEQRVLGHYLGIDKEKIPVRPELKEFFKKHPLPGPDWAGWCVLPDTAILLEDGSERAAKDLVVGDAVYSGDQPSVIKEVYIRMAEQESLISLEVSQGFCIEATENHLILVGNLSPCRRPKRRYRFDSQPENPVCIPTGSKVCQSCLATTPRHLTGWTSGGTVAWTPIQRVTVGDYLAFPRFRSSQTTLTVQVTGRHYIDRLATRDLMIDEDLAFLFGVYLAEGHLRSQKGLSNPWRGIGLTFCLDEEDLALRCQRILKEKFDANASIRARHRSYGSSLVLECKSVVVGRLFHDLFGLHCDKKKIATPLLDMEDRHVAKLLVGLFTGDASFEPGRVTLTSTSKVLAIQSWMLLTGLGIPARLWEEPRPSNRKRQWKVRVSDSDYRALLSGTWVRRDYTTAAWGRVVIYGDWVLQEVLCRSERLLSSEVYDFEVYPTHRYCSPAGTYHNSPDVDLEQLRLLALKGEGLDPFESGIYPIQIEEAEQDYGNIPIPTTRGTSPDIQARLNEILSGRGLSNVQVQVEMTAHDGDADELDVILDLKQKREREIIDALQLGR